MTYLPSIRAGIPQAVITHREIYMKIDFRIQSDLCVTQRPKADARFGINNELHQVCQVPAREAGSAGLYLLDQGSVVHPEAAQALLL